MNVEIPKRGRGTVTATFTPAKAGTLHLRVLAHLRRRPRVHARHDRRRRARERDASDAVAARRASALPPPSSPPTGVLVAQTRAPQPGDPLPGVTAAEFEEFRLGLDDFLEVETAEEGLGPAFNGTSCAACHRVPAVGGMSAIAEVRAGRRDRGRPLRRPRRRRARRWSTCSRCPATAASRSIPADANVIVAADPDSGLRRRPGRGDRRRDDPGPGRSRRSQRRRRQRPRRHRHRSRHRRPPRRPLRLEGAARDAARLQRRRLPQRDGDHQRPVPRRARGRHRRGADARLRSDPRHRRTSRIR